MNLVASTGCARRERHRSAIASERTTALRLGSSAALAVSVCSTVANARSSTVRHRRPSRRATTSLRLRRLMPSRPAADRSVRHVDRHDAGTLVHWQKIDLDVVRRGDPGGALRPHPAAGCDRPVAVALDAGRRRLVADRRSVVVVATGFLCFALRLRSVGVVDGRARHTTAVGLRSR